LQVRRKKLEARSEGKQSNVARLLDRQAEPTLVPRANSGQAARNDLATLGNKALKQPDIAVGDSIDLLGAELANLLAPEKLPLDAIMVMLFGAAFLAGLGLAGFYRRRITLRGRPIVMVALLIQVALVTIGSTAVERPLPRSRRSSIAIRRIIRAPRKIKNRAARSKRSTACSSA